jgi:hypothetical protein
VNTPAQNLNHEKVKSNYCVHKKHVYSMIDLSVNDESYKKMNKHLENCSVCKNELVTFQSRTLASQVFIPKALMDSDLRQSFEGEVVQLFKAMNLNEREMIKKNVKNSFIFIDQLGIEFIKNLVSKTMFKTYFIGLVIFICLKMFL